MREGWMDNGKKVSTALLRWYDANAREMPWRISPANRAAGQRPDPYAVWLSEVMLQQTTVAVVSRYFQRFTTRWPDVRTLAKAVDGDVMGEWAGLGYYARARNLLKCAREVCVNHDGIFPNTYAGLINLPGVGPYTAAAISAIAFDRAEVVVDGNVERVMARLFNIAEPLPVSKPALRACAAGLTPERRPGDYAQAVMDIGATICTVRAPACSECPLRENCQARRAGVAGELPRRIPKKTKPVRHGIVYLARNKQGNWLLERRPDKGLLGGMLGWPTSDWGESPPDSPPFTAKWKDELKEVRHTFTHFHLMLKIKTAILPAGATLNTGFWVPEHEFRPSDLPTVMRKAYDLVRAS